MRVRSERWAKMAARGHFTMETKARIGGVDYTAISAPKIDRSLASAPLSVGNCTSATLGLSVLTDDVITSDKPIVIMGRLTDGIQYTEWKAFGTFFIDQRDTSFEGLITVSCYDAMLKANQPYLSDGDGFAGWPKTMVSVVEEIAYRIGVGIDPRTKIKTGADYVVPYPSGKTMIQVLGDIGACHGGNWIITEENLLRLVPLISSPDETFRIISEYHEQIKTAEGDRLVYKEQTQFNRVLPGLTGESPPSVIPVTHYITDEHGSRIVTSDGHFLAWAADGSVDAVDGMIDIPVVCGKLTKGTAVTITGVSASDDAGNSFTVGSTDGVMLNIEGNPYMTQGICNDLYESYNGLVYFPYTATKTLYDPAAELGDQVKIGDMVHSVMYGATLTFDLNFRADISAPNSEQLSEEYPYLSEIKKLKQNAEELNSAIRQTAEELSNSIGETDEGVSALSSSLAKEIDRASGVEQELNKRIEDEETRAEKAENALGSRIKALEDASSENVSERLYALESAATEQGKALQGLETAVSGHEKRITGAEEKAGAAITAVGEIQKTVAEHTESITAMKDVAEQVATLSNTVAAHAESITAIQERLTGIENEISSMNARITALEKPAEQP